MARRKIFGFTVLMAALFAGFVMPDQAEAGRCGCRQRCHKVKCCKVKRRCCNNGNACASGCTTGTCTIGTTSPDGSMAPAPAPNGAPAPAPAPST